MAVEKLNIGFLLKLFKEFNFAVPSFDENEHIVVPETLESAFEVGIEAEIKNFAMFEKFLICDLYDDIMNVFILLRDGTINHLEAFKKQSEKY